jgi:ABC-type transport system substrate-binding protein
MVKTFNFYSGNVADVIFERLVQYDYLANPVKLVPATAQSLPTIEKNGQVYTFKIKSGIYFTDDPASKESVESWLQKTMFTRLSAF